MPRSRSCTTAPSTARASPRQKAVEKAESFDDEAVVDALRHNKFDTVLGRLGFDDKGDVTGAESFIWYVWKDGKYGPVEPGKLTE
jgi:branched-chain amino acid transport system substrate-binding protein